MLKCSFKQNELLKFKPSIRMGEKDDLSDFVIVFGAKWVGLTISETADLNIRPLFITDFFFTTASVRCYISLHRLMVTFPADTFKQILRLLRIYFPNV